MGCVPDQLGVSVCFWQARGGVALTDSESPAEADSDDPYAVADELLSSPLAPAAPRTRHLHHDG